MATPSSSTTSASPPMSYLPANSSTTSTIVMDPAEREERKRAVQKFLARAEISMVTRALRTRLSYASYKAKHNIPHASLRDLEAQCQSQAASISRVSPAKRKAGGSNNYYNNPSTQGSPSHSGVGGSASSRGAMAPPAVASASRNYSAAPGTANRSANATQSLYTSLLAPPPAKQARTILNASDPPLTAASRPSAATRPGKGSRASPRSMAESTRSQTKSRKSDKPTSTKGKGGRASKGKQKALSKSQSITEDPDVDMKAAATLTSLLLHSRPSIGSLSSPRSSIGSSDASSSMSHSQFAQSSTRTTTTVPLSADASFMIPTRSVTPQPSASGHERRNSTPKASQHTPTDDSEAANLMLFLATSPSPARPTTSRDKDSKDMAAFRTLGGNSNLIAKGRVLFPSSDSPEVRDNPGKTLARGNDSFTTSISTLGSQIGSISDMSGGLTAAELGGHGGGANPSLPGDIPMEITLSVPTPTLTPSQLLPAPPSPSASQSGGLSPSIWPSYPTEDKSLSHAPPTPGNIPFNFNDFINVSPSPAAVPSRIMHPAGQVKSSLRADVGRKLFEEEQQRHLNDLSEMSIPVGGAEGFGNDLGSDRSGRGRSLGLGAGIDLVQT